MIRKELLSCFIIILMAGILIPTSVNANTKALSKSPIINAPVLDGSEAVQAPEGLGAPAAPRLTDDPIGDTFVFGTTYYDYQHNTSCGRMIQVDIDGWVHAVWMKGLDIGGSQRHIYYNLLDDMDNLQFGNEGTPVDGSQMAGYTVLEIMSDGRAVPSFHQRLTGAPSTLYHTAGGFDYFPHVGAFTVEDVPWYYYQGIDLKIEWPHIEVDRNDVVHFISTYNPLLGAWTGWGNINPNFYCRGTIEGGEWVFTDQLGNEEQEYIYSANSPLISTIVAASPVSDKVTVAWAEMNASDPDTNQYDNNLYMVTSEDGLTFDWEDIFNLTDWIPPDAHLLPDTLAAYQDTLRVYPEFSMIYDYDDVLHVFFSTELYYANIDTVAGVHNVYQSMIWHWDEYYQVFSLVASGLFENFGYNTSVAWHRAADRTSPGIDPATGDIYCAYLRLINPIAPSELGYPYFAGDTADVSASNIPNGDIWITKSTNGGYSWSEGINITSTRTPGETPGNCASEMFPTMAPDVVDGNCHVFYIYDRDAGFASATTPTGSPTLNDMIYQRVPIAFIPESPRLMPYPMHCDSTGMPPDTIPPNAVWEREGLNAPENFKLAQNYPNPFNPVTNIEYSLNMDGQASLKIYNISGEEAAVVFDENKLAGNHTALFDASELSSGVYFYKLESQGFSYTKKMVLMK